MITTHLELRPIDPIVVVSDVPIDEIKSIKLEIDTDSRKTDDKGEEWIMISLMAEQHSMMCCLSQREARILANHLLQIVEGR